MPTCCKAPTTDASCEKFATHSGTAKLAVYPPNSGRTCTPIVMGAQGGGGVEPTHDAIFSIALQRFQALQLGYASGTDVRPRGVLRCTAHRSSARYTAQVMRV